MSRISPETIQRILAAVKIEEVVGDYVKLRRHGSSLRGLCPFHNERNPSFSVSPSRGICKCFTCQKGGTAVNFLMELEGWSYQEAMRYLAAKYDIEVEERELTPEENERITERESMMAVNEMALKHFSSNLTDTDDGRDIGLSYFRHRGINDLMIKKFQLGYALEGMTVLYDYAIRKGFSEKYLEATGLCAKRERGGMYDRFRGRVIYPVFSVSGKVVAFGGRTLRNDKKIAKYVNSPESLVYHKSNELYGLYQARQAIARANKTILVEGYMDVISMHQNGVENVVASSGTALTVNQIKLIRRFSENVTVIYDSDPAGIKASLRGIDMLLAEGLKIKVLLLPEGEDPDSFSQSHSTQELRDYIDANETDFIRFKTNILLKDTNGDPAARADAINSVIQSISMVSDPVTRDVYVAECSRLMGIDEHTVNLQLARMVAKRLESEMRQGHVTDGYNDITANLQPQASPESRQAQSKPGRATMPASTEVNPLFPFERVVLMYAIKYGAVELCSVYDEQGNESAVTVADYISDELQADSILFSHPIYAKAFDEVLRLCRNEFPHLLDMVRKQAEADSEAMLAAGFEDIRSRAEDLSSVAALEQKLRSDVAEAERKKIEAFRMDFVMKQMLSSPVDDFRELATELGSDKYVLSKVHTKYSHVETERERLAEFVPRALYEWKDAILGFRIHDVQSKIDAVAQTVDTDHLMALMKEKVDLINVRKEFARILGERIISPR